LGPKKAPLKKKANLKEAPIKGKKGLPSKFAFPYLPKEKRSLPFVWEPTSLLNLPLTLKTPS